MATDTFVGWKNLINALGLGLIAMLLTLLETVYTGVGLPETVGLVIGVIVGGGYLLETEWNLSSRFLFTR